MELDPGAWVVHRPVVDAPVGGLVAGPDVLAHRVPTSSFAAELERDLLRLEHLSLLALSDEVTAAG